MVKFNEIDIANLVALAELAIERDLHLEDGFVDDEVDGLRDKIGLYNLEHNETNNPERYDDR